MIEFRKVAQILEEHLKRVEQTADELYIRRLKVTIANLQNGDYKDREHDLIKHLTNLGFHDLAQKVRMGLYI